MKKLTLCMLAVLFGISVLSAQTQMVRISRFEGKPITGVMASQGFEVSIIAVSESETSAVVEIPAELEDRLIFELTQSGVVKIGFQSNTNINRFKKTPHRATIKLKVLNSIHGSSAADINCSGAFESQSTVIDLSSAADVDGLNLSATQDVTLLLSSGSDLDGTINAKSLQCTTSSGSDVELNLNSTSATFNLSSGSEVEVKGSGEIVSIHTSSGSSFKGEDYTIKQATIDSSSASSVSIGVATELSATGSSASSIRYRGNPTIKSLRTSSASSIKKVE